MTGSNSEARKRAAEKAVRAMKAEVWDEALEAMADSWWDGAPGVVRNPYRDQAS